MKIGEKIMVDVKVRFGGLVQRMAEVFRVEPCVTAQTDLGYTVRLGENHKWVP